MSKDMIIHKVLELIGFVFPGNFTALHQKRSLINLCFGCAMHSALNRCRGKKVNVIWPMQRHAAGGRWKTYFFPWQVWFQSTDPGGMQRLPDGARIKERLAWKAML